MSKELISNQDRNKPCLCKSGRKFKKCCMNKLIQQNDIQDRKYVKVIGAFMDLATPN